MQVTSAETNAASVAASLGMPVKVLTNFVQDSPVSRLIRDDLRRRGMSFEGPELRQGGPWGFRHQFNVADSGYGGRGPRVHNDRAGEVGRELRSDDFDFDRIFRDEGVKIVHLSGLIAALSEKSGQFCLEILRAAKNNGSLISFDLNYRASFWQDRSEELRQVFREIASEAHILVGNEEDFQLCLGFEGPATGGEDLREKIAGYKQMMERVSDELPQARVIAATLRQVISANKHLWGAVLRADGEWRSAPPREIGVLDRIGGGDGFVGGLLYGILRSWSGKQCMRFGWAAGALAASLLTDYSQPVNEDELWSIWEGNARVIR